ncbi:Formate hydrogenlyase subunit 3/Multisubunit Na+/H+ antiporter, MnhD subunit [Desulfonatronum thiosulfatophilum]|uniref:Formate hydrogenlyase subunit 3/Multisubunit Na+/H+ antiporter, MnhD subunit n=1 Tax=Desulfonatronum thiosulfatophilum TaxID=617002 RepID=A0A1G6DKP3_9BACT|nr:proton-conducting transporter membrane subunit [Desulfonatronum thiosulfatophilum]SDB45659.1 Formate hydrogenlyase subunit 3/Multisubunit Na+/H+ antiporter, MnhD subunit [Desulfonatronum thiosulfatophilum]
MNTAMVAVFMIPFSGAALAFVAGRRAQVLGLITALATTIAVVVLTIHVLEDGAQIYLLGGWSTPLGINLNCDGLALLMLSLTAAVSLPTSIYAALYFANTPNSPHEAAFFWPLWLFLWGGLNCLFLSGDIFNVYLLLELTLLASVALAALKSTHEALIASYRYLIAATAAALFYLLGVTLLYSEHSTLDFIGLAAAEPDGYLGMLALALLIGGLSLKSALFPLHFWLPPAHSTAPTPVSAVLSALVVKAGFYVILRIWFEIYQLSIPDMGSQLMALLGSVAVVWGSWQALRQKRLKMLIAYSTVAQMGYLFLVFPMAAGAGEESISVAVYQVISHGLSKAAMFLAAGVLMQSMDSDLLRDHRGAARSVPFAVAALVISGAGLAGIAPGGGAKGKMISMALEHGQWWWAAVIGAGMLLAAAYTFVAVRNAFGGTGRKRRGSSGLWYMGATALVMALAGMAASFVSGEIQGVLAIRVGG